MSNKTTVWFAVDEEDGQEYALDSEPLSDENGGVLMLVDTMLVPLPTGTIEKLTGRKLTWQDEPIEWDGEKIIE